LLVARVAVETKVVVAVLAAIAPLLALLVAALPQNLY
jgi:hypothetical protein